jgi:hypothetical protein
MLTGPKEEEEEVRSLIVAVIYGEECGHPRQQSPRGDNMHISRE